MLSESRARLNVTASMFIYGTVGIFVRLIPLPSPVTAMARGLIGAVFLLAALAVKRSRLSWPAIRRNLPLLCLLGAMLGANWILLFEAYRYTTVATATLCYYFAPIILVALSPIVFHERLSLRRLICVLAALLGIALVSGVVKNGIPPLSELRGVVFGLAAALLYAGVVMLNKKVSGVSAYERTVTQLLASSAVLLVYNTLSGSLVGHELPPLALAMLVIVGVVHTGVAYLLYFGSMEALSSQTLAILSYIDPVTAVLLSALLLREPLDLYGLAGAVLILGAAFVSELPEKRSCSGGACPDK